MSKRLVGWFDRDEFEAVHRGLYSEDDTEKLFAMNRVAVWKCRLMHRLPSAIESTAELVAALINCSHAEKDGTLQHRDKELRLQFSMAVIRFVNLLTENRQVAARALPVHMLAEEIGLPVWLVELRHEASHQNLPQLTILKTAVNTALSWLEEIFWREQLQLAHPSNTSIVKLSEGDINCLLNEYCMLRVTTNQPENIMALKKVLKLLRQALKQNRSAFLRTLCQDGYLIPTAELKEALSITDGHPLNIIPSVLMDFWEPILTMLDRCNCVPLFIIELLDQLGTTDSLRNNWLARWFCGLVYSASECSSSRSRGCIKCLCKSDVLQLVKRVTLTPSIFTQRLLQSLSSCFPNIISKEMVTELNQLVNMMIGIPDADMLSAHSDSIKTVDMLNVELHENLADCSDFATNGESWKLDGGNDWSDWLLGLCPKTEVTYTSLVMPNVTDLNKHLSGSGRKSEETCNSPVAEELNSSISTTVEDGSMDFTNSYHLSLKTDNICLL